MSRQELRRWPWLLIRRIWEVELGVALESLIALKPEWRSSLSAVVAVVAVARAALHGEALVASVGWDYRKLLRLRAERTSDFVPSLVMWLQSCQLLVWATIWGLASSW